MANHFKALELYVCKKLATLRDGDCLVYNGKGKECKKIIGSIIYYTRSTLGEYLDYMEKNLNKGLFKENVNFSQKKDLINSFKNWKVEFRNAYQHKDILSTIETVESIRKKTLVLFRLFEKRLK